MHLSNIKSLDLSLRLSAQSSVQVRSINTLAMKPVTTCPLLSCIFQAGIYVCAGPCPQSMKLRTLTIITFYHNSWNDPLNLLPKHVSFSQTNANLFKSNNDYQFVIYFADIYVPMKCPSYSSISLFSSHVYLYCETKLIIFSCAIISSYHLSIYVHYL